MLQIVKEENTLNKAESRKEATKQMAKQNYRPKTQYINKPEYYEFKDHQMIKIPIKTNPNTGYGEAMSMGVSKAKGILDNLIALRKFVNEHEEELKVIADDAHLKQDEDSGR